MLNVQVYIKALENTAANLPGLLKDWATIDPELREHYTEALIELLCRRDIDDQRFKDAWAMFSAVIRVYAPDVQAKLHIDVESFLR